MKIKDLKVGDSVVVDGNNVRTVARVTRKAVVVQGYEDLRFSRITGWALGMDPGHYACIEIPTTDLIQKIQDDKRRGALFSLGVNRLLGISSLARLAEIVDGITE